MGKKKKIVVIGGGTGTYTVLKGLRVFPVELSAIVSMADDGGSNRILRDEFGLLPTSDIRQCMVALASGETNGLIRELFTYRYSVGTGIGGMTFGNLFMAALTDILGSQERAIEETCKLLDTQGEIVPVTFERSNLVARYSNGQQVLGEHNIDEPDENLGRMKIVGLEVFPPVRANPKAIDHIKKADMIVFGPGDLFTSTICNLAVGGVSEAVRRSRAKKVLVVNLMTKFGQTNGFGAKEHLEEVEKYLGKGTVDVCLVNKSSVYSKKILEKYAQEKSEPVDDNLKGKKPVVLRRNFMSGQIYKKQKSDKLVRSLIRHDAEKLAKALMEVL